MSKTIPKDMRETHYSEQFQSQLRKVDSLENSLSTGSKNRLQSYKRNLALSGGLTSRNFDSGVLTILQKYVWSKDKFQEVLDYLYNLEDSEGYKFSRNLKIYSSTESAMSRFAQADYTSFRWNRNYQESLKELMDEFSETYLSVVEYYDDDDIRDALPKLDTHSGFTYIISGKKYKGENLGGIHDLYEVAEGKALSNGSFNSPILIGFRTQASGEFEDDGSKTNKCKHKLRVVSMIDLLVIIAELKFAKPIQKFMASKNFYAGGKDSASISGIISNWRADFDYFRSIDYSSFDQTISSWLIEDAFKVVKSAFHDLSDKEEHLFDVIVHDFIHKDFILNEGILHSDKGVPSGSMFTQIIDSIVNMLVVKTYYKSIGGKVQMIVMGDDNAIFTNSPESIEDLASYIMKNFGLEVKTDDKSSEGSTKFDDLKFLSRYWKVGGQWRHPNQLISRLLYSERHRNYNSDVKPEHVVFAFILTYKLGMEALMDTESFVRDYPISQKYIMEKVDSRYLPGALAFIREYSMTA